MPGSHWEHEPLVEFLATTATEQASVLGRLLLDQIHIQQYSPYLHNGRATATQNLIL